MATLRIETAEVFVPLLAPARYKGAWGGRGSGKSHFFAELLVEECLAVPGTRAVCIREVQKTLKDSAKRLVEDKIRAFGLAEGHGFRILNDWIETPGGGQITFQGMQDHTAESIKSLEGYRIAWVEEAQSLSSRSLQLLRPTIRTDGSELWFSWNPRRKTDAVDAMLRGESLPTGAVVVRANWSDNPRFPAVLEQERQDCLRTTPEQYDHVWQGGYATVLEGAYYAQPLAQARADGRIGRVAADPLLTLRAFVDIGGTGARADSFVIWIGQFCGKEIRLLDYYEAVGQPLAAHLNWMRGAGYTPDRCQFWLPHDGAQNERITDASYESALRDAGYRVTVVPNQGKGAAKARIEAARRLFGSMWFNEPKVQPGLDALGWYHERKDESRNIGLGPEHDWCFSAGTMVLTTRGWVPIEDVGVHNRAVTPFGSRRIIRSGIVRMTDQWVITNGIRSTPEHRFFTKRGLVEAASLRSGDEFWTRADLGLRLLGLLCATSRLGFMAAITSATQGRPVSKERRSSYTAWFMRLCTARFRRGMKSIISTTTRLITTLTTSRPFRGENTESTTSRRQGFLAYAGFVGGFSAVTKLSAPGVAKSAGRPTAPRQSAPGEKEPAYSLTVERDECYFVLGSDGNGYLVSNSSHAADAFGLMCVAYEEPKARRQHDGGGNHWMA